MSQRSKRQNRRGRRPGGAPNRTPAQDLVPRSLQYPLSTSLRTTLRYGESHQLTVAAGVVQQYVYNLNSIFDPNRTGAGHQPMGYDQLAPFFNRYRVNSCTYTIRVLGGGLASYPAVMVAVPSNNTTAYVGTAEAIENPLSDFRMCGTYYTADVIHRKVDLAQFNGVSSAAYVAGQNFEAAIGGSPTETMVLTIVTDNQGGAANVLAYAMLLEYDVTFFDPIQLGQS
jgi:hypothetical protein